MVTTSFETFNETENSCCAPRFWVDWPPNFIHVMLKSGCPKILEARSRCWRRPLYLRLRKPAKKRKNSFTISLVKLKRLKQSWNFGEGSYANMYLIFYHVCKVHLEMVKVAYWCWICCWNYKLQREFDRRFQDCRNLDSGIKILLEIDFEPVPIDVQMEQWFLIVAARIPGGVNAFPEGESPYAL